ncbi:DDHD domain-containing protein [Linnemannia elongata]|nr:DDHD domain-containing protein [Linnemannia elongata]
MSLPKQTTATDVPSPAEEGGTVPQSSTTTPAMTANITRNTRNTGSNEKDKAAASEASTTASSTTSAQPAPTPTPSPVPPSSSSSTKKPGPKVDQYPHHVIFVVHGMGRQLEEFGNYERNVGYLVENTKTVLQSQFHDLKTDVHIIPIEWHAKLHSMVDQRMSLTSLRTVPKVRLVMNDYFADILYYFNNYYGAEIVRMIVEELNEAYLTFIAKHPDFNGKVAVYALSLGGVAMFDILTCMDDDDPEDPNDAAAVTTAEAATAKDATTSADKASKDTKQVEPVTTETKSAESPTRKRIRKQDQPKYRSVVPKLKFRPDFLFTVGSPVGAVMVMRNLDWETFHPPEDIIHHNLFHPFDPLAYRIEPLIDPIFAAIPAVTLTSTGNSQRFPISLPSLASLPGMIPGTISSFLENKVPNLPIPSIPTAVQSTLSQMTQSLKAGRWLVGGGGGGGGVESGSEASTPAGGGIGQGITTDAGSSANDSGNETPGEDTAPGKSQKKTSLLSERTDADASATEAIAAATAATYLDQRDRGPSSSTANPTSGAVGLSTLIDGGINTTTGSPSVVTGTARRPSLGPRRISSRVENETVEEKGATESFRIALPTQEEADEQPPSTTQAQASGSGLEEVPPPLHMEYYLGMEKGPSTTEREQGEGAKSRVVQEEMVRSVPSSPILDTHANHKHFPSLDAITTANAGAKEAENKGLDDIHAAHEIAEASKLDGGIKSKKATIADDTDGSDHKDKDKDKDSNDRKEKKPDEGEPVKVDDIGSGRGPLHVGGRETKVPYRIDHVLQETRVDQYTNEYLLGMRSHFRYWGNRDIAYHILKNILQQEGSLEGEVLNLNPEMPRPVSAPKNAKEAAKAKAKANAASYHADQQQQQQHRKSFSFSSFNPFSALDQSDGEDSSLGGSANSRGGGDGGSGYYKSGSRDGGSGYGSGGWYAVEEELYGYRYSDLDVSSAANVGFSNNTLFQNSPFSKSTSSLSSAGGGSGRGKGAGAGYKAPSSIYPPGDSSAIQHQQQREQDKRKSSGAGQGLSHTHPQHQQHQHNQQQQQQQEEGSRPSVSEEDIFVPNLTRPPRLHHRSSRLDDKRGR